jgi:hypothetical protein
MSEQNIVNISEANLQQTLQQSMNVRCCFISGLPAASTANS